LFAHLQQVTGALSASSELIANAVDKQQLSERISNEQMQLKQSADLMAAGPVPAPLADANRRLLAALRAIADDFARRNAPAARGCVPPARCPRPSNIRGRYRLSRRRSPTSYRRSPRCSPCR